MKGDAQDRWWRRKEWLLPLGLAVILYPLLLMGSSDLGSIVGLSRDVNAQQVLARALSYSADPRLPVVGGNDGQLVTPALDSTLVALQLGSGSPSGAGPPQQTATATAPAAPPPAAATPPAAVPPPAAGPPPAAAPPPPAPRPTAKPVAPPPPPPPAPTPSPTPTPNCNLRPIGIGIFDGQVVDPNGDDLKGGATLQLFWKGCLFATVSTGGKGNFVIPGLAAGTPYSYIVTAPNFNPGAGAFTTDALGNHTEDPQVR